MKRKNSAILYGPPGTGKTTLVRFIAEKMDWKYIRVDTNLLLNDGIDNAAKTIGAIFDYLQHIKNVVILFDEIDECIRKRSDKLDFKNRLLTNMMLTKLNDLSENQNILYFVATNNFSELDDAIIRPGRFDYRIYLGYPAKQIHDLKGWSKLKPELQKDILKMDDEQLQEFNINELETFVDFLVSPIMDRISSFKESVGKFVDLQKKTEVIFYIF